MARAKTSEPAKADAKPEAPAKAPGTVTVGCKLPNGLHVDHKGKRVTLNGSRSTSIMGGHGITTGIDRDWFFDWLKEHAEMAIIRLGHIFAHEDVRDTAAEAEEKKDEKTGLEGINPDDKADKRAAGVEKAEDGK